jgi:hypothetical protein
LAYTRKIEIELKEKKEQQQTKKTIEPLAVSLPFS